MESGKLDFEGAGVKEPVATYKSLPDDDLNGQVDPKSKETMGLRNGENDVDDGVQERMLKEDNKIGNDKDATEVKFISENGDAKIDIETIKQTLAGMGKEELMKYANDPFWVRLRWFLFVAFWALWAAMLAGAVAIIVMAPKCSAPEPKKWWEESPIVQLKPTDTPQNTIKGLESLLDPLSDMHIKAISLDSILETSPEGDVIDFRSVNSRYGRVEDVQEFAKAAEKRGQHVILEFNPNHSSLKHIWFQKSVKREEPYTNYYVWADKKPDNKDGLPNDWMSFDKNWQTAWTSDEQRRGGRSAWEWNAERGQYYLHQFNVSQPDLNYNNSDVIQEFGDILRHWMKLGIHGFRLADTQFLYEDPSLPDENHYAADDYKLKDHIHTRNRWENGHILKNFSDIVSNGTNGEGLLTLRDDIAADMLDVYNQNKSDIIVDLPQHSNFLAKANSGISAETLHGNISKWLSITSWPGWDVNGEVDLEKRMPPEVATSIALMTMLLPGTPILRPNNTIAAKGAFTALAKARSEPTILYGKTATNVLNNTVFVYTRLKSGNPGYLVAYQTGEESSVIDLSVLPEIGDEVSVVTHSPNYVQDNVTTKTKLDSRKVPISPKSTLVVTFVPKANN